MDGIEATLKLRELEKKNEIRNYYLIIYYIS